MDVKEQLAVAGPLLESLPVPVCQVQGGECGWIWEGSVKRIDDL